MIEKHFVDLTKKVFVFDTINDGCFYKQTCIEPNQKIANSIRYCIYIGHNKYIVHINAVFEACSLKSNHSYLC